MVLFLGLCYIFLVNKFLSFLKVILLIILVWLAQILFLYQASRTGFNGWDDWGQLFYYEVYNARDLRNLPFIVNETGTPYMWTEEYNIGPLKDIFGIEQRTIKFVQLLFKALAALSVSFLTYKLTKDKLFAVFALFFFVIFPSTAGVLPHIIFIGAYLTIVFMCFSVLFYIQSSKQSKKIFLASLFFFLALLVSPPRAYLILPVPLLVELYRLGKGFKIFKFLLRMFIFYSPLIFLQSRPGSFIPHLELFAHLKQIVSGNLYSLSFPFQAISALYIDKSFLNEMLQGMGADILSPYPDLNGLILVNLIIVVLSFFFGFLFKGKKLLPFALKVLGLTVLLEIIFLLLGFLSTNDGKVTYINYTVGSTYTQTLSSSIYQAALGGFYFILGLMISLEWWFHQKDNKVLTIISAAWLWTIFSEFLLYFTNHWYYMVDLSFDRYIIVSSVGAVIFAGGLFSLIFRSFAKIKNLNLKLLSFFGLIIFLLIATWKNFYLLDRFYYNWNEEQGWGAYWQDVMNQRFLDKLGRDKLKESLVLYADHNTSQPFDEGSFIYPSRFRLFFDEKDRLIRNNCKGIIAGKKALKQAYRVQNGEKGFIVDSICVNPVRSFEMKPVFYPLSNFYAYKIDNKQFIDIRSDIVSEFE